MRLLHFLVSQNSPGEKLAGEATGRADTVFQPAGMRDAFGSIRGFVYQVALTIERWLALDAAMMLELERGEDIDICESATRAPEAEARRTLEQVKRLDGSITLRSPEVVAFLAHSYEHRTSNPDLALVCRFVTTASTGIERPTPLTPRQPAISRWRELSASSGTPDDGLLLEGLRELLRGTERPRGVNADTWGSYAAFLREAGDADFLSFCRQVEWSTGYDDEETVRARVRDELVVRDLVGRIETADAAYRRLFFHVFHLLARPGLKRLSANDLRDQLWRHPTNEDLVAFARFESMFTMLGHRIDDLETEMTSHRQQIAMLALAPGVRSDVLAVANPITFDVPPAVPLIVARQPVVTAVRNRLMQHRLLLILGEPGFGKTQVSRLVAAGRSVTWVRLRHGAAADVAGAIARATNHAFRLGYELLVLDDLGRISDGDPSSDVLLALMEQPFRTMITSPLPLPARLRGNLGALYSEFPLPPFSVAETRVLLELSGAPAGLMISTVVDLVCSLTRGHPTLIRALIEYVRQREWRFDEGTLEGLFAGDYAAPVRETTQRLMRATVADEAARALLYRLDLVVGAAGRRDIETIAAVKPAIALPFEKVADLRGLWLQDGAQNTFRLSPLLSGIGEQMLATADARAVHLALAETITSQRRISPAGVERGLHHLTRAGAYDRAGALYILTLTAFLSDVPKGAPALPVFFSWLGAVPNGISRGLRAAVRAVQVRLLDRIGRDPRDLLTELLDELSGAEMRAGSPELQGYLYAAMMAGPLRGLADDGTSVRLAGIALHAFAAMHLPGGEPPPEHFAEAVYGSVWVSGAFIRTPSAVREWLALVNSLSPAAYERSLSHLEITLGVMFFMPRMIVLEAGGRENPDWVDVAAGLAAIETFGQARGLPLLAAGAVAANITMLAEYQNNIGAAKRIAARAIDAYAADRGAEFAIREALGTQLARLGQDAAAALELERAVEIGSSLAPMHHVEAAIRLSAVTRANDPGRSLRYATMAVELVGRYPGLPLFEIVGALAELGIATADVHGAKASFEPWREGALQLLAREPTDESEQGLFAVFGHCLGYYLGVASTGRPPDATEPGEEYAKPRAGMFLQNRKNAASMYRPGKRALLAVQVEMYAEAVKDLASAVEWGRRAMELVELGADEETRALVTQTALPFQLRNGAFAVAISGALAAGVLAERRRQGPGDTLDADARLRAEGFARFVALVPAYVRAATLKLQQAPTAGAAAAELANTCRSRATDSGDLIWELAASIIEKSLVQPTINRTTAEEFQQEANGVDETSLKAIAALAFSLSDDITPVEAIVAQLPMFHAGSERWETPTLTRLVTIEFLEAFWRGMLRRARFRFSAPRLYETELADAATRDDSAGVASLVSATLRALSLPVPEFARQWLATR